MFWVWVVLDKKWGVSAKLQMTYIKLVYDGFRVWLVGQDQNIRISEYSVVTLVTEYLFWDLCYGVIYSTTCAAGSSECIVNNAANQTVIKPFHIISSQAVIPVIIQEH